MNELIETLDFNLNKKIKDTLKPLNIPVAYANYNQSSDTYVVFLVYNEASRINADDDEVVTKYFIQLDLFSRSNFLVLAKNLQRLMKSAGFGRMFASETYDIDMKMYRKIFRFNYEPYIGEEY